MDQPQSPNPTTTVSTDSAATAAFAAATKIKKRPPTPEELLAHYESQGLESKAAALKAISHLQTLLFRSARSGGGGAGGGRGAGADRKLDGLSTRMAILEMKVDSKPGIGESLGIGVAAGAIVSAVVPNLGRIWEAVRSVTKSSRESS